MTERERGEGGGVQERRKKRSEREVCVSSNKHCSTRNHVLVRGACTLHTHTHTNSVSCDIGIRNEEH